MQSRTPRRTRSDWTSMDLWPTVQLLGSRQEDLMKVIMCYESMYVSKANDFKISMLPSTTCGV